MGSSRIFCRIPWAPSRRDGGREGFYLCSSTKVDPTKEDYCRVSTPCEAAEEGEPFKITLFCLPLPWHLGDFGGSFLTGDDTSGFKWRNGKGLLISFGRIFFMPVCVKVTRGQWGRGNLFLPSTTPTLRPTITCTSFGGSHPSQ